jgi:hypothetical protein
VPRSDVVRWVDGASSLETEDAHQIWTLLLRLILTAGSERMVTFKLRACGIGTYCIFEQTGRIPADARSGPSVRFPNRVLHLISSVRHSGTRGEKRFAAWRVAARCCRSS